MRCGDDSDRNSFYLDNDIPDLEDTYGAYFEPVCPTSALCSVDTERRTILCTCSATSVRELDRCCTLFVFLGVERRTGSQRNPHHAFPFQYS